MNQKEMNNNFATINLFSHHASPGAPKDFDYLLDSLSKNFQQGVKIRPNSADRFSLDSNGRASQTALSRLEGYQIGHSWGCAEALFSALQNKHRTLGVILISPFLFTKKINAFTKGMIHTPFVSNLVLSSIGKKSVETMFSKEKKEFQIEERFRPEIQRFSDPKILKKSILEKDIPQSKIISALQQLEEANIPILVLWGADDQTSLEDEQIKPLAQFKNITITELVDAPHGLLWTHGEEMARDITNFIMLTNPQYPASIPIGHYPGADERNNVVNYLTQIGPSQSQRPILNCCLGKEEITLDYFLEGVNNLASFLLKNNIKKGDAVALFCYPTISYFQWMFAIVKCGAKAISSSILEKEELRKILDLTKPNMIVGQDFLLNLLIDQRTFEKCPVKVSLGKETNSTTLFHHDIVLQKGESEISAVQGSDLAIVYFINDPKSGLLGLELGHRLLSAKHQALNRHLPYSPLDSELISAHPILLLHNLFSGSKGHTLWQGHYLAENIYNYVTSHQITCLRLSYLDLRQLINFCQQKQVKLENIRRVGLIDTDVSIKDLKDLIAIVPHAEINIVTANIDSGAVMKIDAADIILDDNKYPEKFIPILRPMGAIDIGLDYKFIKINKGPILIANQQDWNQVCVPDYEVGELIISGEQICHSYCLNEEVFLRNKIRDHQGNIWHRTGLIGRIDQNSHFWVMGEINSIAILNEVIYVPKRIEAIARKLSFVDRAHFEIISKSKKGETTSIIVTLEQGHEIADPALVKKYKSEIKKILNLNQVIIDEILIVDKIPDDKELRHKKIIEMM